MLFCQSVWLLINVLTVVSYTLKKPKRMSVVMAEINNCLVLGSIYDPDTDSQYILLRVSSRDWDAYLRELDEDT
jgi:hypothetical protein